MRSRILCHWEDIFRMIFELFVPRIVAWQNSKRGEMMRSLENYGMDKSLLLLVLAVFLGLAGCRSLSLSGVGKMVSEENRIPLVEAGTEYGSWQTRDLTLDYRYSRDQSTLGISGAISFAGQLKKNFSFLEYFYLSVIFLDSQGRVLEMRGLTSTNYGYIEYPITFNTTLTVPYTTQSIAFSYRGQARSAGSHDTGSSTYFWEYPIH